MSYRVNGVPLSDDDLLELVSDQPCVLCQEQPPSGVGVYKPPHDGAEWDLWTRYGEGPRHPDKRLLAVPLAGRPAAPLTSRVRSGRVRRSLRVTPAMEAGVADRVWELDARNTKV